jgi:hypothetical protein
MTVLIIIEHIGGRQFPDCKHKTIDVLATCDLILVRFELFFLSTHPDSLPQE